ncbi:MAG TPA: hypothetical protein VIM47_00905 [Dermatophilaceae bacterium]
MGMFFRRGTTGVRFVPTIVAIAAPTAAELTAGTDLRAAMAAMEGFETSLNRINQPLLKYKQEVQIDGPQQFGDAKITLIEDDGTGATGDDLERKTIYTALAEQATGFIVINPAANSFVAAAKVEVWPIRIGSKNRSFSLDAEPARYVCELAITGAQDKNAVVAA